MLSAEEEGLNLSLSAKEISEILVLAERATLAGANAMINLVNSGTEIEVHRKDDHSIVMNLDLAAQAEVLRLLDGVLPIVSEERPDTHHIVDSGGDYLLVDPLDGTASCQRCLKSFRQFRPGQVGFGPMVGIVSSGILVGVSFFEVGAGLSFSASVGKGAFMRRLVGHDIGPADQLRVNGYLPLNESAMLFYPGTNGEMPFVSKIRENEVVDTLYRFGGFANDCSRAARDFEQSVVQFSLKAWDFPAVLIPAEAGLSVCVDPAEKKSSIDSWVIRRLNPVVVSHPKNISELISYV